MTPAAAWRLLGIVRTNDVSAIRAAYAARLKPMDLDADPEGYHRLRDARDIALALARQGQDTAGDNQSATASVETEPTAQQPPVGTAPETEQSIKIAIDPQLSHRIATPLIDHYGTVPTIVLLPAAFVDPELRVDLAPSAQADSTSVGSLTLPLPAHPLLSPAQPLLPAGVAPPVEQLTLPSVSFIAAQDDHYRELHRLLFDVDIEDGEEMRPLTAEESSAAARHLKALLDDPRMEELQFWLEAEEWFANVLAGALPRSEPLIEAVVTYFKWRQSQGTLTANPRAAALVQRADDLKFVAQVTRPSHEFYGAWRELSKPAVEGSRRSFGVRRKRVIDLLNTVRRDHPALESRLDYYRVGLWEEPNLGASASSWRPLYLGLVLLVMLIRIVIGIQHAEPSGAVRPDPVASSTPHSFQNDVADAIDRATASQVTAAELKAKNPALYAKLESRWNKEHITFGSDGFIQGAVDDIFADYSAAIVNAPYPLALEHAQFLLWVMEQARTDSPAACAAYWRTGAIPRSADHQALFARQARLVAAAILLPGRHTEPKDRSFLIKGPLMKQAAMQNRMSISQLRAGFDEKASDQQFCDAQIAVLRALPTVPAKDALPILQKL